jgi:hypothetical protein
MAAVTIAGRTARPARASRPTRSSWNDSAALLESPTTWARDSRFVFSSSTSSARRKGSRVAKVRTSAIALASIVTPVSF